MIEQISKWDLTRTFATNDKEKFFKKKKNSKEKKILYDGQLAIHTFNYLEFTLHIRCGLSRKNNNLL